MALSCHDTPGWQTPNWDLSNVVLGLLALGVCANAFSSAFNVDEVSAGHVGHTNLGGINHPIQIVCQKGC